MSIRELIWRECWPRPVCIVGAIDSAGKEHIVHNVQPLLIAKRDLRLPKMIKQLSSFEGLIIDDLGYVQQNREEMEVLFTLGLL